MIWPDVPTPWQDRLPKGSRAIETCPVRTYPATRLTPAETCGAPLAPGSDLCPDHDAEEQAQAAAEDARWDEWKERDL